MGFEVLKQGDLADRFEAEASDYYVSLIEDHCGVSVEDLPQEQVDKIWSYAQSDACWEYYVKLALTTVCDNWTDNR